MAEMHHQIPIDASPAKVYDAIQTRMASAPGGQPTAWPNRASGV